MTGPIYAAIGVVVVNLGVSLFGFIIHRWRPWRDNLGRVGLLFVLLPTALFAWLSDPWLWIATAFSMIGLVFMRAFEAPGVIQHAESDSDFHSV